MTTASISPTDERLEKLADRARCQFPLPPIAKWLLRNGHFANSDVDDLLTQIAPGTTLYVRLLAWCNSPLFNWSETFPSLRAAALVIDADHILRLAFLAMIRDFYSPPLKIGSYSRDGLWKHSIAVGVVASFIARTSARATPVDALLAGALHEIGLLATEKLAPSLFSSWLANSNAVQHRRRNENLWFGAETQSLGTALITEWGLPESIVHATQSHRGPDLIGSPPLPESSCVAIADYLCSRAGRTATGTHNVDAPSDQHFANLEIDHDLLRIAWTNLPTILVGCDRFQ
ncbi:HDOD domain protein [Rosistilla carotiformis]|uniref:HDOD domain protein n=1 Tax=Rosistilla carotiformis TaxID=2528017 RepID=A0A518JP80_9BACT|nr:HDOD domain-containing protein [Rosistilla carotiformis]QDV67346.1 HDOD domain protein [Rosistilla carotiformis]